MFLMFLRNRYPFRKMQIGDSFLLKTNEIKPQLRLRQAASQFAKRNGWDFTIRKQEEGVRIWRTK